MIAFCLSIHHLWGRTLAKHYQDACAVAYAHDGYIKAKLSIALEVLSDIKHVLREGQWQRQAPLTATRPPSFGIHAESGVPLVVFHLSGPAVPASPEVRHPSVVPSAVPRSSSPRIGCPSRSCVSAAAARASRNIASFTSLRSTRPQSLTPPCAWR
jgi:hypothetical protein